MTGASKSRSTPMPSARSTPGSPALIDQRPKRLRFDGDPRLARARLDRADLEGDRASGRTIQKIP